MSEFPWSHPAHPARMACPSVLLSSSMLSSSSTSTPTHGFVVCVCGVTHLTSPKLAGGERSWVRRISFFFFFRRRLFRKSFAKMIEGILPHFGSALGVGFLLRSRLWREEGVVYFTCLVSCSLCLKFLWPRAACTWLHVNLGRKVTCAARSSSTAPACPMPTGSSSMTILPKTTTCSTSLEPATISQPRIPGPIRMPTQASTSSWTSRTQATR